LAVSFLEFYSGAKPFWWWFKAKGGADKLSNLLRNVDSDVLAAVLYNVYSPLVDSDALAFFCEVLVVLAERRPSADQARKLQYLAGKPGYCWRTWARVAVHAMGCCRV
jgi:hypothetical protein